jgi:L-rhamnose mutarotase
MHKHNVCSSWLTCCISAAADSIYFDNDRTLFATFKYIGTDIEADMKNMASLPKMREWWAMTDEMQVC